MVAVDGAGRMSRFSPGWWRLHGQPRFVAMLIAVGAALVTHVDHIFRWDLFPRSSTVLAGLFLGASAYFGYGVIRPVWAFAAGPRWGLLAYDLVPFSPYIALFFKDEPASGVDPYGYGIAAASRNAVNEPSLVSYMVFLSVTAILMVWTLVVPRDTRIWGDASHVSTARVA